MSTDTTPQPLRAPLSRERVLEAALWYVDQHGLEALSMHRLGTQLGVKAMSLYNHVGGKDDILDGMVEVMWAEIRLEPMDTGDWQSAVRAVAHALRDCVHRHPQAAPLLTSRQVLPEAALRTCDAVLRTLREGGVPDDHASPLLRTVVSYGFGYALTELSCWMPCPGAAAEDEFARIRRISAMLPAQTPEHLVRTAVLLCGDCDMSAEFDLGVDLMVRGLERRLRLPDPPPAATGD